MPENRISSEEPRTRIKLKTTRVYLQNKPLQWSGHPKITEESVLYSKRRTFKVSSSFHTTSKESMK